jgi:hypothetical protein
MSFINQEPVDCPICFDVIGEKNSIVTECGHKFHASCLMTNVSRNGFGCPCCRSVMAENHREEEVWTDSGSDNDHDDDDEEYEEETLLDNIEPFSDDALRGLRLLTNLLENEEPSDNDIIDENHYRVQMNDFHSLSGDSVHVVSSVPSREFVTHSLRERGVTYEQLVAWLLCEHDEYEGQGEDLENFASNIWDKIRMIISNYSPSEPEVVPVEQEVVPVEPPLENPILGELEPNESPIPNFDEWYNMLLQDDDEDFYNLDRKCSFDDLDELRVELSDLWEHDFIVNTQPMCV